MSHRIAVVGAGFCGTVLATHLLRQPAGTPMDITLIERGPAIGRGVAYAARGRSYLLNVPAGRMSADSQEPRQFLEYARRTEPDIEVDDYLSRHRYGDYLQDLLDRAEREATPATALRRLMGEVTAISRRASGGRFELRVDGHPPVIADSVVLALGTPPPRELSPLRAVAGHPAYHAHPWSVTGQPHADRVVVILGNGLSMADAVWSLCDDPARIPRIVSLSRRGLLPLSQSTHAAGTAPGIDTTSLTRARTIRQLLAASRRLALDHAGRNGDWRDVVTAIRHLASGLWQQLPHAERQRFIRHLQSYWDVHRHRLPPSLGSRLDSLRRTGRLEVHAGRLVTVQPEGDRIRLAWRSRGNGRLETRVADAVVNALGPEYAVRHSRDPLLRSLLDGGMISEDPLQLGLQTAADGACVDAGGRTTPGLYYLGPLLRATHWEATAATELRDHAERLARHMRAIAS